MDTEHAESETTTDVWARRTAPQSAFSTRDAVAGLVVFLIGIVLTFGLPTAIV